MTLPARSIDIVDVIDQQRLCGFQIRIIVLCGLVTMLDGFDAQSIAFVAPVIADAWGIKVQTFGPTFAAALVGLTIGALTLGIAADRFGRKWVIILSSLTFGLFTLLTVRADSINSLMMYRFLTGIGLGGAMPNVIALTAEYSPKRIRTLLVTIMFCGFPLGAVVGGAISSQLIPAWGWQSVFYAGGVLPLVLVFVLIPALPESIRFMVTRGAAPDTIFKVLRKIAPSLAYANGDRFVVAETTLGGLTVKHLFTDGRAVGTVLLWVCFFMNLLLLFFMYNWLPPVLKQAGLPIERAIMATVLFNLGGIIGGLIQARLIDRMGSYFVLVFAYGFAAVFVGAIGFVGFSIPLIMLSVFLAGAGAVGAQFGANALAAGYYPTSVRSTGVGWALGIGRIGSILGPLIGGILLSLEWAPRELFLLAAVPALVAAAAIFALGRLTKSSPAMALEKQVLV